MHGVRAAAVGLDEVCAAAVCEGDLVVLAVDLRCQVLALRHGRHVLEESAFERVGCREVEREEGVGATESAMHVPVRDLGVTPFIDVDERLTEVGVDRVGPCQRRLPSHPRNTAPRPESQTSRCASSRGGYQPGGPRVEDHLSDRRA